MGNVMKLPRKVNFTIYKDKKPVYSSTRVVFADTHAKAVAKQFKDIQPVLKAWNWAENARFTIKIRKVM